jgi:hypothetical protein
VQEAFVHNAGLQFTATADENGWVNLAPLPDSITALTVSRIGYESRTFNLNETSAAPAPIVYLDTKISSLEEVTIRTSSARALSNPSPTWTFTCGPSTIRRKCCVWYQGFLLGSTQAAAKPNRFFCAASTLITAPM